MSSTISQAKEAIIAKFIADWANETPFDLDNAEFIEPEGAAWVRVVVKNLTTKQATMGPTGNRKFLRAGAVFAQIFVPEDTGTFEADRLSEKMRAIFEGIRLNADVWFLESKVREIGSSGKFYQVNVDSIFNYEQTK